MKSTLLAALKLTGRFFLTITSVIGVMVIALVGLVILLFKSGQNPDLATPPSQQVIKSGDANKIAVVYLSGTIVENADETDLLGGSTVISSKKITKLFDYLALADDVKAVVLRINSPGGAVVASDDLYRQVLRLRAKKPVITSFGDVAASGGYYLAAGSDVIVANPATITGSIGVIAQFPQLSGLYDKIGVEMRVFKSGEFKDIGSEARDLTAAEEKILNSIVDDSYQQFISVVSQGRNLPLDQVKTLADGRIYSGKQAKDFGLVDELGNLDKAIEIAQTKVNLTNPTVIEYSQQNFFSTLLESFSPLSKITALSSLTHQLLPSQAGVYYLWGM